MDKGGVKKPLVIPNFQYNIYKLNEDNTLTKVERHINSIRPIID